MTGVLPIAFLKIVFVYVTVTMSVSRAIGQNLSVSSVGGQLCPLVF